MYKHRALISTSNNNVVFIEIEIVISIWLRNKLFKSRTRNLVLPTLNPLIYAE